MGLLRDTHCYLLSDLTSGASDFLGGKGRLRGALTTSGLELLVHSALTLPSLCSQLDAHHCLALHVMGGLRRNETAKQKSILACSPKCGLLDIWVMDN